MTTTSPTSVEQLDIYRNATRVGVLRRTSEGCVFEYERAFWEAHRALPSGLATHLPYASRRIETRGINLPPYFAGLLPEGLRLRALISRTKTSEDDQFSLLAAAGSDCVGDLFPVLPGAPVNPLEQVEEERSPLDRVRFDQLLERSLVRPGEPSVAGVQEKLSPSVISFPFATRGARWILKLDPDDKPRLVENEHFFLQLARRCGLRVPTVHLVHDARGASGLLVQRFDRVRRRGQWRGLHQEDACQLLDRYPADKYRLKTSEVAEGLGVCASPLLARAGLLQLVAFSYLVGNGDLHAKNLSVSGEATLQLSPAYDLLSTRPYKDLKLALQFEGRDDNLTRRDFLAFGARFGIPPGAVAGQLERLVAGVGAELDAVKQIGLDARVTRQLVALMTKRCDDLRAR